ncbi:MAG TPA: DUF4255 domain-containing protein [Ktedonobacteraceae bacterium]|jgi:hypothetical protein|nr:DUF4255 domain-containing protein [Ktedonobacteraceae bacterium]
MSNYLAIATVTVALRDILQDVALTAVPGAVVTTQRPEDINNAGQDKAGINLYLYQVTPNPDWTNNDLPMRDAMGRLLQRPQTALDLDYLLSFHGAELEMVPQRLLGSTIVHLHTQPFLPLVAIQDTIQHTSYLAQSDLFDQGERVKFSPLNFSLEELSKLWSVFFQIPYRLSVAYRASVVLLEEQEQIPETRLVTRPVITLNPEVS